jgi:hypothetical protein
VIVSRLQETIKILVSKRPLDLKTHFFFVSRSCSIAGVCRHSIKKCAELPMQNGVGVSVAVCAGSGVG